MTNDAAQPHMMSDIHTYRSKAWVILLYILYVVIFGLIAGVPLVAILTSEASASYADYGPFLYLVLCTMTPAVILVVLVLLQLIVGVISAFVSYIRVTPEGIESRGWPYRHIRARWSEVERLDKYLLQDAVYLQSYEVMGFSLSFTWPWKYIRQSPLVISLSSYHGWPNGQLAHDLKRYAPWLSEKKPVAEEVKAPQDGSSAADRSQENRLLAALAHISILFFGLGIFVPIFIYAKQKQKTSYLAFQALQAFVFQLVGNIVGFLLPFCLIGALLITVFSGAFSGMDSSANANGIAILIISGAFTLVMAFATVVFGIYGIVGAVMTYQGKDFRYAMIGKWLEKRNYAG